MSQEIDGLNRLVSLGDKDFHRLSNYIMSHYGIKLPPAKKTLLQCRLQKRLKAYNMSSFSDYINFVFSSAGQEEELSNMIDEISTNKTDFFREPIHFDFLSQTGLKEYLAKTGKSRLTVWSAGCSSGEEPYTIAMVLREYARLEHYVDFKITATDISTRVLQMGMQGIYHENKISEIPYALKKEYFQKGKNSYKHHVRVHSDLRRTVDFHHFNLLSSDYTIFGKFDIIFCRNVLIYFERAIQDRILNKLCNQLNSGGYLFLGHSETTMGFTLPLKTIRPSIFNKLD
jgi:chemotaxis protein methyltransferase CheR